MGVLALCLCVRERVLLQGVGQKHWLSQFVWEELPQKMCRCAACACGEWGSHAGSVCEGDAVDAGEGELAAFVVNIGLGAAG